MRQPWVLDPVFLNMRTDSDSRVIVLGGNDDASQFGDERLAGAHRFV